MANFISPIVLAFGGTEWTSMALWHRPKSMNSLHNVVIPCSLVRVARPTPALVLKLILLQVGVRPDAMEIEPALIFGVDVVPYVTRFITKGN